MALSWEDVGYVVFFSVCILVSFLLDYRLRKSIRDTPEESKTVITEIYVSTSYAHQIWIFSFAAPVIFRSIFGPVVPGSVVRLIQYVRHGSFVVMVVTLGYGALVKFGFLVSFGRMSEVSEKVVKRLMYCLCLCWVLVAIIYDLAIKWHHGMEFSGSLPFLNENKHEVVDSLDLSQKWFGLSSLIFATLTHVLVLIAKVRRFVLILPNYFWITCNPIRYHVLLHK